MNETIDRRYLATGGVDDGGAHPVLTVELLGVSGNKVAIRGDGIADGTLVLVPV